jgi:NADPH oxidase 2
MSGYNDNDGGYREKQSERSRWTPLTRMLLSGEMTQEKQKELSNREKFDRWMINEGYRRLYVFPSSVLPSLQFLRRMG